MPGDTVAAVAASRDGGKIVLVRLNKVRTWKCTERHSNRDLENIVEREACVHAVRDYIRIVCARRARTCVCVCVCVYVCVIVFVCVSVCV